MGPMLSKRVDDTGGGWSSSEGQRNGLPMFVSGRSSTLLILFFFLITYMCVCMAFTNKWWGWNLQTSLVVYDMSSYSLFPFFLLFFILQILFFIFYFSPIKDEGGGLIRKNDSPNSVSLVPIFLQFNLIFLNSSKWEVYLHESIDSHFSIISQQINFKKG